MKNIFLTALFMGCFISSAAFAEGSNTNNCSNTNCFTMKAKVKTGVVFASDVKGKSLTFGKTVTKSSEVAEDLAKNTPMALHDDSGSASFAKNCKQTSSAFIGVALGTSYHVNETLSVGTDVFYNAMNIRFALKNDKSKSAKIRGTYGLLLGLGVKCCDNFSIDLSAGIANTTKIKGLKFISTAVFYNHEVEALNTNTFYNNFNLVANVALNYILNNNVKLGLDLGMQRIKAKSKKFTHPVIKDIIISKGTSFFKANVYTIGASLTYNF